MDLTFKLLKYIDALKCACISSSLVRKRWAKREELTYSRELQSHSDEKHFSAQCV